MRGAKRPAEPPHRFVHFNSPHAEGHKFASNKIKTSLYKWWNAPFKLTFEELCKAANFYFLCVSALQMVPAVSNTNGVPTTLPALLVVMGISMALKWTEDRARHRADKLANNSKCHRRVEGRIVDGIWIDVQVGDVLQILNHEALPADLLLIAGYEPDPAKPRGACHVETKQLDGETNLKGKTAPALLTNMLGSTLEKQLETFNKVGGYVECEAPNPQTNKFVGTLCVDGQEAVPLSIGNVLLRGSSVRNTEYVLGLVLNTGSDTKVMQGARKPPLKLSSMDRAINWMMLGICIALLFMCTLSAGLSAGWTYDNRHSHYYLQLEGDVNVFLLFLYFLVLLASFVSVTLYVSIQLCKFLMAWFMENRTDTYDITTDTPLKVRTAVLTDEIGLVSHIFSDKTGTLTQNVMQFRKCSIAGVAYGRGVTEIGLARNKRLGIEIDDTLVEPRGSEAGGSDKELVNFEGPELEAVLTGKASDPSHTDRCRHFFLSLGLCHTVVTETVDGQKRLSASSPDESALVAAAAHFGYEFVDRHQDLLRMKDNLSGGKELTFEMLDVLEFSSARRRMSVVVRDTRTGALTLITKGADSVMLKLLKDDQTWIKEKTEQHMLEHSNDGLRTLVLASKQLRPAEYSAWNAQYRRALQNTVELERKARDEPNEIDRLCDLLEVQLDLLGSTAIEDKLQVGVPGCIADLSRAGIAVWVLTGDKEETAINIAFACQLFDTTTKIEVINGKRCPTLPQIAAILHTGAMELQASTSSAALRPALVIDGEALEMVLKVDVNGEAVGCQLAFLKYTRLCSAVVACRCAPSQKAQLVKLLKRNLKDAVTLAIGDGANDVAMIQAAHVGVGISGQEGMQAANSADFAISQFRFLRELLLVQGRNNYRRMANLILYVFYKNIMMVLTVWYFNFYCGYSGQKWNLEWGYQAFNAFYTALPILWITCFDRDVSDATSKRLPQLYFLGIQNYYFTKWVWLKWLLQAVAEAVAITFICLYSLGKSMESGSDPELFFVGAHTLTLAILVANLKLVLWQWSPSWYGAALIGGTLVFWWLTCAIAATFPPGVPFIETFVIGWVSLWNNVQGRWPFWFLMLLVPAVVLLPQGFVAAWRRSFYPEFRDVAIEAEVLGLDMTELERWELPEAARRKPLAKKAPLPPRKRRLQKLLRCC